MEPVLGFWGNPQGGLARQPLSNRDEASNHSGHPPLFLKIQLILMIITWKISAKKAHLAVK